MAKKLTALDAALFQNIDPYGSAAQVPAPGEPVYLPLDQVHPDPNQPRRILPPDVLAQFQATYNARDALAAWARRGREGDDAAAASYAELESLANSLTVNGLINSISVAPNGDGYLIASGERRWWAHQILEMQGRAPKGGKPGHIEAIVRPTEQVTIIHQMAENLHRQDLCAVEAAIGLAMLIVQIEGTSLDGSGEQSATTVALSPDAHLAGLRAVANRRLKEGTWAEVINQLGKTRQHWAHHLALLRLPDHALALAWHNRLAEGALRPAVAEQDPKRQIALVKAAAARQQENQPAAEQDARPGKAAQATEETQDQLTVFHHKLASGLRAFGRAFDALDGKINPRKLTKEIAGDENFGDLAQVAKKLLPVLQAIVDAQAKSAGRKA